MHREFGSRPFLDLLAGLAGGLLFGAIVLAVMVGGRWLGA